MTFSGEVNLIDFEFADFSYEAGDVAMVLGCCRELQLIKDVFAAPGFVAPTDGQNLLIIK